MIFARKMPEFYIHTAGKIFSPNFRGHVPPLAPVSYAAAYGYRLIRRRSSVYANDAMRDEFIFLSY